MCCTRFRCDEESYPPLGLEQGAGAGVGFGQRRRPREVAAGSEIHCEGQGREAAALPTSLDFVAIASPSSLVSLGALDV